MPNQGQLRVVVSREAVQVAEALHPDELDRLKNFIKLTRDPDEPDPGLRRFKTADGNNYFHLFPCDVLVIAEMGSVQPARGGPDLGVSG